MVDWVAVSRVRFSILSAQFELELELEKATFSMQCCQADD
jgi:hypothetical protein